MFINKLSIFIFSTFLSFSVFSIEYSPAVNKNYPDRFGVFLNLDLAKIDKPDFEKNNIMKIENAVSQGVIGLKIYKNLGLT